MKKDTFIKKFIKILLVLLLVIGAAFLALFGPLDRTHWKEKKEFAGRVDSTISKIPRIDSTQGKLKAGWGKASIIPASPIPIASYGIREKYKKIHDSLWCRTLILDNGVNRVALVTLDLLIFPPVVAKNLKSILEEKGYPAGNTFFSASHTHNAPGGWAEKLGGRFLAGEYNEKYVSQLTQAVIKSIELAESDLQEASIGFGRYEAKKMILNRYSAKEEETDHWLRVLKIQKASGQTGLIITYAAHPNILDSDKDELSGDYAGELVDGLEKSEQADFAAFFAGAVGAHTCTAYDGRNYEAIHQIADYLKTIILSNNKEITVKDSASLASFRVPLIMEEPQLKISPDWKVRSWAFHSLLGEQEVFLSALKVDDIVLVGTPCDFGGELVPEFSNVCKDRNLKLAITSFNGGYIGYVIPDKHYDVDMRESRDMTWYGPHNGEYFVEVIKKVLEAF